MSKPPLCFGGAAGGGNLPWETPLTTIQTSLTGPVAFAIFLIAIVAAGATLVWGGEISEFTRRIIFVVLCITVIALAAQTYTQIFAVGAVI